mgnify:CR=1 FL=1
MGYKMCQIDPARGSDRLHIAVVDRPQRGCKFLAPRENQILNPSTFNVWRSQKKEWASVPVSNPG